MEIIIRSIIDFFNSNLGPELIIFIISMIPVLELRGGLVAASLLRVDWRLAMIICIIGNMVPIPFILLFIKKIFEKMQNTRFASLFNKLEEKANRSSKKVFKYKNWGLYLFVAIPFPGTGAWTGSMVAALFGIKVKNAFISIFFGVLTAAVIMALLSYGVLGIFF